MNLDTKKYMKVSFVVSLSIIAFFGYNMTEGYSFDLGKGWIVNDLNNENRTLIIDLPGNWNSKVLNNINCIGIVILQKKFLWDRNYTGELILHLGKIAIIDETYVNGHCIGKTGTMPNVEPLSYEFFWLRERVYKFNSSILKKGENTLEIKVFSHYLNGIDMKPKLYTLEEWEEKNKWKIIIPDFNNINSVWISLMLLVMLIPLSRGVGNTSITLYVFLFVISVLCLNILLFPIIPFSNNLWRFKLFYICYLITDFVLVLALEKFFNKKGKIIKGIFAFVLLGTISIICYIPTTFILVHYCIFLIVVVLILYISYSLYLFVQGFMKDPRRYWYITIIAVVVLISAMKTYYMILTNSLYALSMSMTLRLPLLVAAVFFAYLFDVVNIKLERDSLITALIDKSKHISRLQKILKTNKKPKPQEIILQIKEYLDVNFNEKYDRSMLSKKFGINEDYMCQLFKKITTMNIAQYINMKRIEMAKQLLAETESKVIDIAFHVGFDNLTYFYRSFKQFTGLTPNEFRATMKTIKIDKDLEDEAF